MLRSAALGALVIGALVIGLPASAQDWNNVETPAPGPPQVIGTYTAGCIAGAVRLPSDGPGYEAIRLSRNHHWGHPATITFVEDLTQRFQAQGLPHVYVGDISPPRGGPVFPLHASHQIGLDVDIFFDITNRPRLPPARREMIVNRSMVLANDTGLDLGIWQKGDVQMLKTAAERPATDRIFVNRWIKRYLCDNVGNDRAWLRKITPWYGHDDHFHVRLACPAGAAYCLDQDPVPPGDGCGGRIFVDAHRIEIDIRPDHVDQAP